MATLVHPSSAESTTSQLDLFSVPPSQTSLEEGSFTKYHPLSVLTSTGPIEFTISAENSNYIDLANSFLYVRASVTTAAGADLAKNVEIAPECNFLHTPWTQVDVYLNGLLVTQSNNNYPYRAYIEFPTFCSVVAPQHVRTFRYSWGYQPRLYQTKSFGCRKQRNGYDGEIAS